MSPAKPVEGVFAAVGTPRHPDGSLDLPTFRRSLEFLIDQGIRGFAINGATGEYCLTSPEELKALVALTVKTSEGRARFICGVGSAGVHGCLQNARIAIAGGAPAVLLPMPHFFPYAQADLEAFCRAVAGEVSVPILLYNLPFTSTLQVDTALRLMQNCPQIVGIKDSTGSLDILSAMSQSKMDSLRIVGSDGVLAEALSRNCCDGVISGVASVAPALILSVWNHATNKETAAFQQATELLREFIDALNPFPVPWGLKLVGEISGIAPASFSQPLAPERLQQIEKLRSWWPAWEERRARQSREKVA